MLGAIIGDIVGSRFEFNPTNDYDFEFFSEYCGFTDDTICTVAVADALLKGKVYGTSIHEWCRKYPNPMGGYGTSFRQWVMSDRPKPYGSYGNGSAMRVGPIGMWFDDDDKVIREAEKCAACSHNHPEGIKGAQAIAWAVYAAVKTFDAQLPPKEFTDELIDLASCAIIDFGYDSDIDYTEHRNQFDETCQGTVPVALDIIGQSNSFEDAVRKAVSLGADADTLGAIVGSIAEHIWGIPEWIKERVLTYLPEEMKQVVSAFYDRCDSRPTYKPRRGTECKAYSDVKEKLAIMKWKLGLGDFNKAMVGEDPLPDKSIIATPESWKTSPMPSDPREISDICFDFPIPEDSMKTIFKGHIPAVQEDHWFMYCDSEWIRYFRSWTGMCAFEAHYTKNERGYVVDRLRMNHALAEFGVNGNDAGEALFQYLILAEAGGDAETAWMNYEAAWLALHIKYRNS